MQIQELVAEQTKEWTAMASQQLRDEYQLIKTNIEQQNELLSRLMTDYQHAQLKDLELRHDRQAAVTGDLFPACFGKERERKGRVFI